MDLQKETMTAIRDLKLALNIPTKLQQNGPIRTGLEVNHIKLEWLGTCTEYSYKIPISPLILEFMSFENGDK